MGTRSPEQVDYPDYAHMVAGAIETGRRARGVVVCGTGIGVSIAANRHAGVRAAVAWNEDTARLSREHNDANVLSMGGRIVATGLADEILGVWLNSAFAGGRHQRRIDQITEAERSTTHGN